MKVDPSDFPPSVPPEAVKKIVALQDDRDALRWWSVVGAVMMVVASIFLIVASAVQKWPPWVPLLPMTFFGVMGAISRFTGGRTMHRVLVEQGFTCPKCHAPMFTDTWSMKKQETERDALFSGRCSRCFEHVDQILLAPVDRR